MAVFDDETVLNDASTAGDWTTSGFDSPLLNNSSSTVPWYIEGTTCMDWPLKKGTTDGYTYDGLSSTDFTGMVMVFWYFIPAPDVTNIPVSELWIQISSAAGFTTNYGRWNALTQLAQSPGSFVPLKVYTTNADETSGTPNYAAVLSYGFTATTGDSADGKAAAFDQALIISYIGGHSETWTNLFFDDLRNDATNGADAKDLGVFDQFGDFYKTSVNIRLGHGTSDTADTVVTETGKTIFFDNVQPEQNLGYQLQNPSSTHELKVVLNACSHFWNEQDGMTPQIFTTPNNADQFRLDGCSFARGGEAEMPTHSTSRAVVAVNIVAGGSSYSVNDTLTGVSGTGTKATFNVDSVSTGSVTAVSIVTEGDYTVDPNATDTTTVAPAGGSGCTLSYTMQYYRQWINSTFDSCGEIDIGDGVFEGNTIANATSGVLYAGTGTRRSKDNTYTGCTDALSFDTAQTISIDGDQFSGNTDDIHFSGTGTLTINAINGANPATSRVSGGGTVVINNTKTVTIEAKEADGTAVASARVLLEASAGPLPADDSVTITRVTTTATVSHTAHGMANGDKVTIRGADQSEYNGVQTISNVSTNAYDYTVSGSPTTPATGTITATAVVIDGVTNGSGILETTAFRFTTNQPVSGVVRKGTTPGAIFKDSPVLGTVTSDGFSTTVIMVPDE